MEADFINLVRNEDVPAMKLEEREVLEIPAGAQGSAAIR
jgi:hypothetical protein